MSDFSLEATVFRALTLDGKGGLAMSGNNDAASFMRRDTPNWTHLRADNEACREWLENESLLHPVAVQALLSEETRPRTLCRGSRLLITLRGVNTNIATGVADLISLRCWSDGEQLVTSYLRALDCTDEQGQLLEQGEGAKDVPSLLVTLIEGVIDTLHDPIAHLEDHIIGFEEALLESTQQDWRAELSALRKDIVAIRRYLPPQREAIDRLIASTLPWIDDNHRVALRETNDRLSRLIEQLDEIRERASLAQEELLARLSEDTSRRSYVFAVVATLFLPLGFLTGLLGINVGGMPGVDDASAFWWVVGTCVALGAALLIAFRVNRWL